MTTTTYSVPQPAELSTPAARIRQRLARVRGEWRERRAMERAEALAGPVEWARMRGDFYRV